MWHESLLQFGSPRMSSRLSSSVIDKELASKINFREKVGKVDRVPDGLQVRSKVGVALVRVLLGVGIVGPIIRPPHVDTENDHFDTCTKRRKTVRDVGRSPHGSAFDDSMTLEDGEQEA